MTASPAVSPVPAPPASPVRAWLPGRDDLPRLAHQQPDWDTPAGAASLRNVVETLRRQPALVAPADVARLRTELGEVAAGRAVLVQCGDCAEDPAEATASYTGRKEGLARHLSTALGRASQLPGVAVGRIAGQYAKPRSKPTEERDGVTLPVYRGHLVNGPGADERVADPARMLSCYIASSAIMRHLRWDGPDDGTSRLWTSHEALVLDYELAMLRRDDDGRLYLGSTHLPWLGDRTRQTDGAHVALLAQVSNPVACKVGPSMTPEELVRLCAVLDPEREAGRLTLIARLGRDVVSERLPALVDSVRAEGHPVTWLSDPMHGNTVPLEAGRKTRYLEAVQAEVRQFRAVLTAASVHAGGLHLETTPDDVSECCGGEPLTADRFRSLCDPRLNPRQAADVIRAWAEQEAS